MAEAEINTTATSDEAVLARARARFKLARDFEAENRAEMLDDIEFEAGHQWPGDLMRERENDPDGARPCLTINKARSFTRLLINDIRQGRPQIKALPVDDKADPEVAQMLNGMLRHIQVHSDADIAYDYAVESQVKIGIGYFRVGTRYTDETMGEQDIYLGIIKNPLNVYMDPAAEHPAGADAGWCFVVSKQLREDVQSKYPKAEMIDWDNVSSSEGLADWYPDADSVIEAEYWERDGDVVTWRHMIGNQVLRETVYPARWIGIVRVLGEERQINGKRDIRGHIRDMKDPQRMYNYWASASTEKVALSPKAPFVGPAEAFSGHEDDWAQAHEANKAYLPYNQFEKGTGERLDRPQRDIPVGPDTAMATLMLQASDDMKAVTNQYDASLGARSNETSGRAIRARQMESDTANFHYVDNLTRSLRHAGRIMVDMIPKVYDTHRVVRVLGEDETPGQATISPGMGAPYQEVEQQDGRIEKLYDPSIGRYDVIVSVGASYSTKRQEAAESMAEIAQSVPALWQVGGDLMVKNMDWPGADELAERLRAILPPEVAQIADARSDGMAQGQAQMAAMQEAMMAQVAPMVEELQMALEEAGMEVEQQDAMIADLQKKLEDKAAELALDKYKVDIGYQGDAEDREAKLAIAAMDKLGADATPEDTGRAPAGDSDSTATAAGMMAMSAAQVATGAVEQMVQGVPQSIAEVRELLGEAVQVTASVAQANAGLSERVDALSAQVERDRAESERIRAAAVRYLVEPDDEALAALMKSAVAH